MRLILLMLTALLAACSPLGSLNTLNGLTPGDGGVRQVVAGAAYGSDPRQRLDVYAPAAPGVHPLVVFFYGGSWRTGDRQGYRFAARALAARGLVVVVPDYRLVPQVRYPAFVEDGAAAVRWALAHGAQYGGGTTAAVMGHSAGAYIAAMLAVDPRWLGPERARVCALVGLAGPYDFAPFDAADTRQTFETAADPATTQPVHEAAAPLPPALLLTGSGDTTVRPRNSTALAARLTALGGVAEVKTYPGIGHIGVLLGLSKPFRGKAPVLADSVGFITAHCR